MTTPLGIARQLRLSFPTFVEVRIIRSAPYCLRAYCAVADEKGRISDDSLREWIRRHSMAGTVLEILQVTAMPQQLLDEEALLYRTKVPRVVAESADTSGPGTAAALRELFPSYVLDVSGEDGHVTVHVDPATPTSRDQELIDTTRLLSICDALSLSVSRNPHTPPTARVRRTRSAESRAVLQRISADVALLHEQLPAVLESAPLFPELPDGSSTYASVHDGVESLLQRLALFDRVYIEVPFKMDDFPRWAGATFEDFVDVLPTGRVIPVFRQSLDRYDPGLTSQLIESGAPRVLLRGEHTLRLVRAFVEDHKALSIVDSEVGAELRKTLSGDTDPDTLLLRGYCEALVGVASRLPTTAVSGQSLATALYPLADWLNGIFESMGRPRRDLEVVAALEHRAATESVAGVPTTSVGHYLDDALRFVYAAEGAASDVVRIPDPAMIGRICFPDTTGLTPREFAETFNGPAVDAMRALMSGRRVQTADGSADLVRTFNRELETYRRRVDNEYTAIGTLLTAVGAFALGVPTALAVFSLDLARRVLGRKAPGPMAAFSAKLTGTTREAALLARIQKR